MIQLIGRWFQFLHLR